MVAAVQGGKTSITDYDAYEELTKPPKIIVDNLTEQEITDDEILKWTEPLPEGGFKADVIKALSRNKGKTWKQAVDEHGKL